MDTCTIALIKSFLVKQPFAIFLLFRLLLEVAEEEIEVLHKIKKEVNDEKTILGVAILGGKIFLVHENSSELEIYECNGFGRKFLKVNELLRAVDICSCKKNNCLYIMDRKIGQTPKEVLKISTKGKSLDKWPTKDDAFGFMSVAAEGNVIITVHDKRNMLLEYSSDGKLVRKIKLRGCNNPWHAVKLDNNRYIVSHGILFDRFHRVCLVDKEGIVKKSFGREIGSAKDQLNMPYYLAAGSNGCVIVADLCNSRLLLLDSNMEFKTKIVPKYKQRIWVPRRIYLDEGLLVVVFSLGDLSEEREEGELLRKAEEGKTEEVDVSKQINKDCRAVVFDIKPLLQKYNG